MAKKLTAIPTNLILGFLGVGKTTAILNLLDQKPDHETWAILVNEFGKVGIDGAILAAQGAIVNEVAGGCLCCATGVPFQVAVNRLLQSARPNRLLIEPTGLGHPCKLLDTLNSGFFQEVLDVRASICLVDPVKLTDTRYNQHPSFIDQIAIADVLVANKTDLANTEALHLFDQQALQSQPAKTVIAKTLHGKLNPDWLDVPANRERRGQFPDAHKHRQSASENAAHEQITNQDEGFHSRGWFYADEQIFDYEQISSLFEQLSLERIKGVLNTNKGCFIFNNHQQQMSVTAVTDQNNNRLEMIARNADWETIEQQINQCLICKQ